MLASQNVWTHVACERGVVRKFCGIYRMKRGLFIDKEKDGVVAVPVPGYFG